MISLIVILAVITIIGIKFSRFHSDYMGLSQTTAIKGFFAVVIVMSHMLSYTMIMFPGDAVYAKIINYIGQLMVTLFFFYSGYGIVVSLEKKKDYYDTFLKTRLLKLLLHFDIAVFLFLILNIALSKSYPLNQYITCWIGWGTIGNSNWFIFDTFIFYIIAFVAMTIKKHTGTGMKIFASVVTVMCLFFWAIMFMHFGREATWWFNTIFCFPAGIWYGVFKGKIDLFAKKWYFYWPALLMICGVFAYLYTKRFDVIYFSVLAPVFCVLITFITMKVKFDNKILAWLGKHSFSIYITQRIPMIIMTHFGANKNSILFTILVVLTVFPFAWLFSMLLSWVDRLLFSKKKDKLLKK